MAFIARSLSRWLVPPGFRDAERRVRAALARRRVASAHREVLARNAELRERHAGRRCFVVGNGPSLARQDLAPLAGDLTFVASGFWKHPVVERWQPTYYCFADPLFFDGSEPTRRFFEGLRARIHDSTFLAPVEARTLVERDGLLPAARTRYLAFSGRMTDGLAAAPDLAAAVPAVNNVVLLAIMAALHMGCSPIYLLGLDHDWLAHRGPDRHFYAGKTLENHAAAHGDISAYGYRLLMENALELWRSYEVLADVARARGARILNATDGGFLDVFERVRYEDVLAAEAASAAGKRG